MELNFYDAKLKIAPKNCDSYYREHMQALVNDRWDNTTSLYTIGEEKPFGSLEFEDIDVHLTHAIEKSTGKKQGDDFREIIFRDLNYTVVLGSCWFFDNCYWIAINLDEYNRVSKNIFVRRCNNVLKYYDKTDGHLVEIPCILEYDATSPQPQVTQDIITANNTINLIVQGNEVTRKIFTNQRFIFGGRPFKVTGFNNYMWKSMLDPEPTILYYSLKLDTESPYDDYVNNIAYNGDIDYSISINQDDIAQVVGFTTQLSATVTNNGTVVERPIKWISSNEEVVTVTDEGVITLVGEQGEKAEITAQLGDNTKVSSVITIKIVETLRNLYAVHLDPIIDEVPQYQTITFTANLYLNDEKQSDILAVSGSGADSSAYNIEVLGNNEFSVTCLKVSKLPLILHFESDNYSEDKIIRLVAMF